VRVERGLHRVGVGGGELQVAAGGARRHDESWPLLDLIQRRSRPSLWALMRIYSRLLERIERSNCNVLRRRISLPLRGNRLPPARREWPSFRGLRPRAVKIDSQGNDPWERNLLPESFSREEGHGGIECRS
jgi:hypothetical protein